MSQSNLDELMSAATQAHAQGRLNDCEKICAQILLESPNHVMGNVLSGVVQVSKNNPAGSLAFLQKAVQADSKCAPAFLWMSIAYGKLGEGQKALERARDAVYLSPNDPMVQNNLGHCNLEQNEFASAEASFQRVLSMAPNVPVVHFELGLAYQGLNRNSDAIASFRRSIKLDPANISTRIALRELLFHEGDPAGASVVAQEIVNLQPGSAEALLWLAFALMEDNRAIDAEPYIKRAGDLEPNSALAHSLQGTAFQFKGQIQEADAHFRRSIELEPKQGSSYLSLSSNRRMTESDRPLVDQMTHLLDEGGLPKNQAVQLHYALGKALEDLGEYRNALEQFDSANQISYRLRYGDKPIDTSALDLLDTQSKVFNQGLFHANTDAASISNLPIFVVGMIRSGTSLVEQILSSHPAVGASGEQRFWLEFGNAAMTRNGTQVDLGMVNRLGAKYEDRLKGLAPGMDRVVDKMPTNFQVLGLIHTAFPRAKVIHIRRNPLDTCISVYTTPKSSRLGWAHDKASLAYAYERYLALMVYWRTVLPPESMLEVDYEDIVTAPEPTIRKMVAFCGLNWDDACLSPEKNERSVVTPSVWQVRQPIYVSSVARWKRYEPWLGPLAKLL